jgi:hypothetical protein
MRIAALLALVALLTTATPSAAAPPQALVRAPNLVWQGAFLLPAPVSDNQTFAYGGTALAYDPTRSGLFVVGHDWYQLTAEVSVPPLVKSTRLGALHRATFLQPFSDATGGYIDKTGGTGNKIGGQLVHDGRLIGTAYVYYDAAGTQVATHWSRPSTGLGGPASGIYRVGTQGAGYVSGYLADVPAEWQARLGGPVLTGNCCIPIISRTSFGPDAFAFDPSRLLLGSPAPATPLFYYPQDHPTLGAWDASWQPAKGTYFGGGTTVRGMVFPVGTRSVLFFGTQGTGRFCYGEGTDKRSLDRKPTPDGTIYCYDPDDSSKGTHAYPYVPEVWAYDAAQLAQVRAGARKPWTVKPYAVWTLRLPFGSPRIGGVAYDAATGRIFVSQQYGNGTDPVIHVFTVR